MTLEFKQLGLAPDFVDYTRGWDIQRELHEKVLAGTAPSTVLLLEHAAVYTAGKRTEDHERPFDGTPVVAVDRGGKLTWHGPGQLIGYPIIKLKNKAGIRDYVERLEAVIIAVLADYGIDRRPDQGPRGRLDRTGRKGPGPQDRRPSASASTKASPCTASRSTATTISPPTARSSPAGSATPESPPSPSELGRDVTPADLVSRITEELRKNEQALVATPEGALL